MTRKHHIIILLLLLTCTLRTHAVTPQYTRTDSIRVMRLISQARKQPATTNLMVYVARQLRGLPYVAKTLEHNERERLVINLRQLDCTTYVENVLAIVLCARMEQPTFADFCHCLQAIRYKDGRVSYGTRLHYFSLWIEENEREGRVREIQKPCPPFSAKQKMDIDYMTTHSELYPMLVRDPSQTGTIARMEQSINGRTILYIPKDSIANDSLYRSTIHDGDILAMVTKKKGLDTSHLGIAVWHKDGLHMLNASMVHKKVVEENRTLYDYMQRNRSQIGVRVVRVK